MGDQLSGATVSSAGQSGDPADRVRPPRAGFAAWLNETNDITSLFLSANHIPNLINLAGGLPDPCTFPSEAMAELSARILREHPADALAYSPTQGLPALRDAIAARFSTSNLRLTRQNVLITTGSMQALELIGKVLVERGQTIAAQSPAYLGALDAWRPRAPVYRSLHLDAAGFDPAAGLRGAQFAYTVPNFSNPTGRLVPVHEREALVRAAELAGTWLIEDDPYGALYYDGPALPRMLTMAGDRQPGPYTGGVVYLGTLSKELAPGVRVGWVIAAPEMITALSAAKQGSDMCTSGLCQMLAVKAFETGLIERNLPGVLDLYRARRDALCEALSACLSDDFTWTAPCGGMFVWATAKNPRLDTDALLPLAMRHGVCVSPSSVFDPQGQDRRSIRLNFTLNGEGALTEGVKRLAAAVAEMRAAA